MGVSIHGLTYEWGDVFYAAQHGYTYLYGASEIYNHEVEAGTAIEFWQDVGSTYLHRYEINYIGKCYCSEDLFPYATYTVAFDANGGTNAPSSQTKVWNMALILRTNIPTRNGYKFEGWATSSTGSVVYAAGGTYTANAGATLYAVWSPQASVMSDVSGTIGSAISLSWTRYQTTFKQKLTYTFGDTSDTIVDNLNATSYSWTPPMNLCNQVVDNPSKVGTITIETYLDGSLIGSNTYALTLTVPTSVVPAISVAVSEGTASGFGVYATNLTKLRFACSVAGAYGSSITGVSVTYDDETYPSSTISSGVCTIDTNTILVAGTRAWTATVTDSRGRTATATGTITVYEWKSPAVNSLSVSVSGETYTLSINYSISSVNRLNNKKITVKRKKVSEGPETEVTVLNNATLDSYSGTKTVSETISDIDTDTYEFTVYVTDTKGDSESKTTTTGVICISRYAGGKGLKLFGEASAEGFHIQQGSTDEDYTITAAEWSTLETWYNAN